MKKVIATFTLKIDLSESVQELIEDGEFTMTNANIREFALTCIQEDVRDIMYSFDEIKSHTKIEITKEK